MRILSLLLFCCATIGLWAQTEPGMKAAFITCQDASGVVLLRDTVRTPIEVCAFVQPPHIPYYHVTNYNEEGWNFCQTHDVNIVFEYQSESVPAVKKLLYPCEEVKNNISVLISATVAGENPQYLAVTATNSALVAQTLPTDTTQNIYFPWRIIARDGGWTLFNEAKDAYLSTTATDNPQLTLGESSPVVFTIEKRDNAYTLKTKAGQYLNVLGDAISLSTTPQALTLSHYWASPFFALYVRAVDEQETEIQQFAKALYAAGSEVTYVAPTLKSWIFDKDATNKDLHFTMSENIYLDLVYRADPTAITSVRSSYPTSAYYDITGRKRNQPTQGIVIVGGKKVFLTHTH